jgi:hypothetical protein
MMRACSWYFALPFVLSFAAGAAAAQSIDDDTKCQAVNAMVVEGGDSKSAEAVSYIEKIMKALDRAHGLRGKPEILPQMTEGGQSAIALIAVGRCRNHPDLTLADISAETYEAVRAMQGSLGLTKSPSKLARREALRQPGLRLRGTLPPVSGPSLARLFDDL